MENCIDNTINLLQLAENLIVEDLVEIKKKARKTILENNKRRIIFYDPTRFTLYYLDI